VPRDPNCCGKAEKRAKLLYITALKDGVLRDGPISIVTSGRESDASLLTRVVFGFLDNGVNLEKDTILKAIWDME